MRLRRLPLCCFSIVALVSTAFAASPPKSSWIAAGDSLEPNTWSVFRRAFTLPAGVTIHGLKYRETAYNAAITGAFSSDEPFLDRLWEKARRTLLVTMRDTYMDCPDRERAQW